MANGRLIFYSEIIPATMVMITRIQPVGMVTVVILVGRVMKLSNRITPLLLVSNKIIWP